MWRSKDNMSDYQTIDIRDWKEVGEDLKQAIEQAVKNTQAVIIRELPHTIVMTGKQYDMLQTDPEMRGFWTDQQRVYVTTQNAMDVIIKETN